MAAAEEVQKAGWDVQTFGPERAGKHDLAELLNGPGPPDSSSPRAMGWLPTGTRWNGRISKTNGAKVYVAHNKKIAEFPYFFEIGKYLEGFTLYKITD